MKLIEERYYQALDGTRFDVVSDTPAAHLCDNATDAQIKAQKQCILHDHEYLSEQLFSLERDNHIKMITPTNHRTCKRVCTYISKDDLHIETQNCGLAANMTFSILDTDGVQALNRLLPEFNQLRRVISINSRGEPLTLSSPTFNTSDIGKIFTTKLDISREHTLLIEMDLVSQIQELKKRIDDLRDQINYFRGAIN